MHKKFLKKLIKKSDSYKTGFDYLRLIIKEDNLLGLEKLQHQINLLDFDNSNWGVVQFCDFKLSLTKVKSKTGQALFGMIIYNDVSVPILYFEEYDDRNKKQNQSWGKIVLYGMFYRFMEIDHIIIRKENSLLSFIDQIGGDRKVSRIDYKIDFFHQDKKAKLFDIQDVTSIRADSKIEYMYKGHGIQSWRLGNRATKNYLIRAYDKLLDTAKKGKFAMYKDYFKFGQVYRLEFEFLNHFCKNYTYKTIPNLLIKIEKTLEVDKSMGNIFEGKNNVKMSEVQDRFKYARSTRGYMAGCINNGINIFGLLEEVFQTLGKSDKQIANIFHDYLYRKKMLFGYEEKTEDIKLWEEVNKIF